MPNRCSVLACALVLLGLGTGAVGCASGDPDEGASFEEQTAAATETPTGSAEAVAPAPKGDAPATDAPAASAPQPPPAQLQPTVPAGGCLTSSVREIDNALATLPPSTGTFCGRISEAADLDRFMFTMPSNVKGFSITPESAAPVASLRIDAFVDGQPFALDATQYPYRPGHIYQIHVSSRDGQPINYRIQLKIAF